MNYDKKDEMRIRKRFHVYCKKVIEHTAINLAKSIKRRNAKELSFDELTPREEILICTVDVDEYDDGLFHINGKVITPELVAEAIESLPQKKRLAVILYYYDEKSDEEIGKILNLSRTGAQYHRLSAYDPLRAFLMERAKNEDDE